ncbi:MAG: nucleotide sugar dehydrogenase [Gammaproteobacteria bacterium]|nr:nucleotide sugar dehydrogenase [Gammaproteobacteria bacterium]
MKIAVMGLGYVGIQLAAALGRCYDTVGFDPDRNKVRHLNTGFDPTGEIQKEELESAVELHCTSDVSELVGRDIYIVAVPTPVDSARRPDFQALTSASQTIAGAMTPGAVVIYESTVYPGATEDICVPVLERHSGLKWGKDFHVGYSPERINPGDAQHKLANIVKLVAADDESTLDMMEQVYGKIVEAGVYRVSSIKVAEAAKVIENTQRDINIALINELALLFERMGIDTSAVIEAASTKWNFLPFKPGLVGGHCIGVDPYYLTYKAEMLGYHPEIILAGRRINDGMGKFVAEQTIKQMIQAGQIISDCKVNVLGLTFKEDCKDIRNSQTASVVEELKSYGVEVCVHDPLADPEEAREEYGLKLFRWNELPKAEGVVMAVPHSPFMTKSVDEYLGILRTKGVFVDVKSVFEPAVFEKAGMRVWRL